MEYVAVFATTVVKPQEVQQAKQLPLGYFVSMLGKLLAQYGCCKWQPRCVHRLDQVAYNFHNVGIRFTCGPTHLLVGCEMSVVSLIPVRHHPTNCCLPNP